MLLNPLPISDIEIDSLSNQDTYYNSVSPKHDRIMKSTGEQVVLSFLHSSVSPQKLWGKEELMFNFIECSYLQLIDTKEEKMKGRGAF